MAVIVISWNSEDQQLFDDVGKKLDDDGHYVTAFGHWNALAVTDVNSKKSTKVMEEIKKSLTSLNLDEMEVVKMSDRAFFSDL